MPMTPDRATNPLPGSWEPAWIPEYQAQTRFGIHGHWRIQWDNSTVAVLYREWFGRVAAAQLSRYASVIAAAPDLLAIVERVAEHFADTDAPLGKDARATIAKAKRW